MASIKENLEKYNQWVFPVGGGGALYSGKVLRGGLEAMDMFSLP